MWYLNRVVREARIAVESFDGKAVPSDLKGVLEKMMEAIDELECAVSEKCKCTNE